MTQPDSRLFQPLKVGRCILDNRIAMAPLTRARAQDNHVHQTSLAKEYYAQRASVPGTLLITEGTLISPQASGYENVPGIWNAEQIASWKEIVDAVHEKGCFIWLQLWALGRVASAECKASEGTGGVFGPSALPLDSPFLGLTWYKDKDEKPAVPRSLEEGEIQQLIDQYTTAALNAVDGAGFDGVEIHGANGFLVDQFIQENSNCRTDRWGGSIENRSRFAVEVCRSVANEIGADRVGIRLSPWSEFNVTRMADPIPQFSHLIETLKDLNLAYLHLIEPRVHANTDKEHVNEEESNEPFIDIWGKKSPVFLAGGFNSENTGEYVDVKYRDRDLVCVFGRYFISTPDLVYRLQNQIPLEPYNRATLYKVKSPDGYTDYPFSSQWQRRVRH
ncbi:uncharacterized protein JN550_009970 [Neoarthrinium moseri]|uniref:uncharacterized protein n=1 Tax=Neoarthrinium moseri TaxID=1658444 RepID=UPI001FDAFA58|nr:uncharacterized protein JN550_009970 [Neoarthrinium moseri]KAI1862823.1 hypothetical protein JN550_009970 [Neoarthrinium moseri]